MENQILSKFEALNPKNFLENQNFTSILDIKIQECLIGIVIIKLSQLEALMGIFWKITFLSKLEGLKSGNSMKIQLFITICHGDTWGTFGTGVWDSKRHQDQDWGQLGMDFGDTWGHQGQGWGHQD